MNATFSPAILVSPIPDRLLSICGSHYSDGEKRKSMSEAQLLVIRAATDADDDALWRILEPVIRAGET
jgi:hypothetical protein